MAFLIPLAASAATATATAATASGTLATIGSIASLASAGVGALGAIQQSRAQAAASKYNAGVATNNAAVAKQNAAWASQEGRAAAEAQSMKTRAEIGGIKANQGASGVDVNSGSALDVRSSAAETGELNTLSIRSNAARQAYGYQTEEANYQGQAALDRSQASSAKTAGIIGAGTTLLGGIGDASMRYSDYLRSTSVVSGPPGSASNPIYWDQ
jgi:hypothetical protein